MVVCRCFSFSEGAFQVPSFVFGGGSSVDPEVYVAYLADVRGPIFPDRKTARSFECDSG